MDIASTTSTDYKKPYMGVSENRGPEYSTLNSRTPIIRIPKQGTPNFRKLPYGSKHSDNRILGLKDYTLNVSDT